MVRAFGVSDGWLQGVSEKVYPRNSFYKNLPAICSEIARIKRKKANLPSLYFYHPADTNADSLVQNAIKGDANDPKDSISSKIVLEYTHVVAGKKIKVFMPLDHDMPWDYSRTQDFMLSLIYFQECLGGFIHGYAIYDKKIHNEIVFDRFLFSESQHCLGQRFDIDQFAWDNDSNPLLARLPSVKKHFENSRSSKYLQVILYPENFQNIDSFLYDHEQLQSKNSASNLSQKTHKT